MQMSFKHWCMWLQLVWVLGNDVFLYFVHIICTHIHLFRVVLFWGSSKWRRLNHIKRKSEPWPISKRSWILTTGLSLMKQDTIQCCGQHCLQSTALPVVWIDMSAVKWQKKSKTNWDTFLRDKWPHFLSSVQFKSTCPLDYHWTGPSLAWFGIR